MVSRLEQDLSCPICHELFRDPVVLSCSHSFCKDCLQTWWEQSPIKTCPFCKRRSKRYANGPPLNLALKNAAEAFAAQREQSERSEQETSEQLECSLHSEKLRLFCLDHQELICLVCRDSKTHTGHKFSPIEEAAPDLREQLRSSMKPLQKKLKELNKRKAVFDKVVAHISDQARRTEPQIRAEFEKLHQLLREQEESRMKALKKDEEQKIQKIKNKMAAMAGDIEAVSKTISETEEKLRAADASFLLQYKSAVEEVQRCPLAEVPKTIKLSLLDLARHRGNLAYRILRSVVKQVPYYHVFLNPNRTGPCIVISDDLSSMTAGEEQDVPLYPAKGDMYSVAGYGKFRAGTHSWVVEVGENKDWIVGVFASVQRGSDSEHGIWGVRFTEEKYLILLNNDPDEPLSVKNLQRVRVIVDFNTKTVTFTDDDTNTDLYAVTETFNGVIGPYFRTTESIPLKILPET